MKVVTFFFFFSEYTSDKSGYKKDSFIVRGINQFFVFFLAQSNIISFLSIANKLS